MGNKKFTREEVNDLLISDKFFSKGNWWLTVRQSLIIAVSWVGVLLPIVWLFFPFFFPKIAPSLGFLIYKEGLLTFKFVQMFLFISFVLFVLIFIGLTLYNNYRFKHIYRHKVMYNEERLEKRKAALDSFYTERFGEKEFRETVQYYSVSAEKNIETDEIKKLYQDKGVS